MAIITTYDQPYEYRIEINGKFSGDCVLEVSKAWRKALQGTATRRYTIDISGLTGFDQQGRKVLREMYRHGTQFAAGTPSSLVFLNEIATRPNRAGGAEITLIRETGNEGPAPASLRAATGK